MGFIQTYKDGQLPTSESTFSLNRLQIGNCNQAEFDKEPLLRLHPLHSITRKLINTFKAFPLYLDTKDWSPEINCHPTNAFPSEHLIIQTAYMFQTFSFLRPENVKICVNWTR